MEIAFGPTTKTALGRCGAAAAVLAAAALALSACSSTTNTSGPYVGTAPVSCGGKPSLTASGSTAQANAMTLFIAAFQNSCHGQTLNYTPNGSGAGISDFISGKTDFGGSDSPMNTDQAAQAKQRCGGSDAWQLPVVFGGVAITYNLNAVDSMVLDAPTIAKIFNGTIKRWDDPAITALNEHMPSENIAVVYRSDASGTTDNFQRYLTAAAGAAWPQGAGQTFKGATGIGAAGNEGTSAFVRDHEGAITYNEWSFAQQQRLFYSQISTPASHDPVILSGDSVGKTIDTAKITGQGNDLVLDTSTFYNPAQPGAYPIVLASYELVCSKYPDPQVGKAVRAFLLAAIGPGQADLDKNGYSPLTADFRPKVSTAVNAIS